MSDPDVDAVRASQPDFFRSLVQALPDLVWIKDADGVYLACNARFEALYGAPEADIVGKTDDDFVPPERAAFFRLHDQAAIAADRTQVLIETLILDFVDELTYLLNIAFLHGNLQVSSVDLDLGIRRIDFEGLKRLRSHYGRGMGARFIIRIWLSLH